MESNAADDQGKKKNEIKHLRKVSRQVYLKKRKSKKLEEFLHAFESERLPDSKFGKLNRFDVYKYDKEIYRFVRNWATTEEINNPTCYRMPAAYDEQGSIDQRQRFAVALKRCSRENLAENSKLFKEQEAWEEHQMGKAALKYGSENKNQISNNYQFVFEDQIDFIDPSVIDGDKFDLLEMESEKKTSKSASEILQDERKTLPIYAYRDELLQAVENHQVLVIIGETGSGKATQVPQYLHEVGYTKRGKVGCTQPRRVAAMSVAARVSQEMGVKIGHFSSLSLQNDMCADPESAIINRMNCKSEELLQFVIEHVEDKNLDQKYFQSL
ncbi:hypothetical protein QYF36_010757 [Acer negundo]|nr:hypothetical protein QYF36_010757 [Acer negundo]